VGGGTTPISHVFSGLVFGGGCGIMRVVTVTDVLCRYCCFIDNFVILVYIVLYTEIISFEKVSIRG